MLHFAPKKMHQTKLAPKNNNKHRKIAKLPWGQQGQQGQQMSVGSVASVVGSVVSRPVAESVGQ